MKTTINNANAWIILWMLWLLAVFIAGYPCFAATEEAVTAPDLNAFEVSYPTAEEAVTQALTEKGVGDKVSALMNGHKSKPLFAFSKPVTVEVRGLKYDKQTGHWDASLVFIADGDVISALPASGHFDEMVEVAVLKREMKSGDIIRENDIEIRDFSLNHTHSDTITDLSAIIGKSPLRTISPYRPIHANEVANPAIMKKDALVQMRYTLPGLEITTSGQALTDGAKGDVINVRNTSSKKIVRAVIESSNTVTILGTGAEHAQN